MAGVLRCYGSSRGRPYLWETHTYMFYRFKQPTANFLSLGIAYGPYGLGLAVRKPMAETLLPFHPLTVLM